MNTEMPTSGNLKFGDPFFDINPARHKHNSIQSLIGLGNYIKSYMRYRSSQLAFMSVMANKSLSVMKYV